MIIISLKKLEQFELIWIIDYTFSSFFLLNIFEVIMPYHLNNTTNNKCETKCNFDL